jgi:hypothetical protein
MLKVIIQTKNNKTSDYPPSSLYRHSHEPPEMHTYSPVCGEGGGSIGKEERKK